MAVFGMVPFKAPGPNGLHVGFYQHMWDMVGDTICRFSLDFFHTGVLEGLNKTLLTLIPKVSTPEFISQFRPISLCNVTYKMLILTCFYGEQKPGE